MDNNEEETKKKVVKKKVTKECLKCGRLFQVIDFGLDDLNGKRICNGCKVTNAKNNFRGAINGTAYH